MTSIERMNVALPFISTSAKKIIDDFPRSPQEVLRYAFEGIDFIGDVVRRSRVVKDFTRNEREAEMHFLPQENIYSFPHDRIYIYKLFWLLGQQLGEPVYKNIKVNRENPVYMRDIFADITGTFFYLTGICDDVIDEFHLSSTIAANFLDDVFHNVANAIDEDFIQTPCSVERKQKLLGRGKKYWQEKMNTIERFPQQGFDQESSPNVDSYKNFALFYSRLFGSKVALLLNYAEHDLGMDHTRLERNRDTFLYIFQKLIYGEIDSLSSLSITTGSNSYEWYLDVSRRKSEPITDSLIALIPDWQPLMNDHKHKWGIAHRFKQLIELIPAQIDDDILDFDSDIKSQQPTIFIYRLIEEAKLAINIKRLNIVAAKTSPLLKDLDIEDDERIMCFKFLFGTDDLDIVENRGRTLVEEGKKLTEGETNLQEETQIITQIIKESGVIERCVRDIFDKRRVNKIRKRAKHIESKGSNMYLRLKIAELYELYHFYKSVSKLYKSKKS